MESKISELVTKFDTQICSIDRQQPIMISLRVEEC